MKISAIIPTYNREKMVVEAVESVLKQTEPPEEVIVINDGSTDNTLIALRKYQHKIRIISQKNSGVSAARNNGVREAKYGWLAFLDSDDLWLPRKLESQKKCLIEHPECEICYTDEEWRKNGSWKNQKKKHQKRSGLIYEMCLPLCIISPSSVLLKGSVFKRIGDFDESLPACEDYDFWLRICSALPVMHLPEGLIVKRAGEWPQLSKQHSLDKYRIIALQKMLSNPSLSPLYHNATRKEFVRKCKIYQKGCLKHGRTDEAKWIDMMKIKV